MPSMTLPIQFDDLDELRVRAAGRLDQVVEAGNPNAQLYGHDPSDGVGGTAAFFLLLDRHRDAVLARRSPPPALRLRQQCRGGRGRDGPGHGTGVRSRSARRVAIGGAALDLVMSRRMESEMGLSAEPMQQGTAGRYRMAAQTLTAAGAVLAAAGGRSTAASVVTGVALLAGSVYTRFGISSTPASSRHTTSSTPSCPSVRAWMRGSRGWADALRGYRHGMVAPRVNRRGIALISAAHVVDDLYQGAVPATSQHRPLNPTTTGEGCTTIQPGRSVDQRKRGVKNL